MENRIECGCEEVSIRVRKDERGAELDDVVVGTVGTGEYAAIAKTIDNVGGLIGGGGTSRTVVDEIDAKE